MSFEIQKLADLARLELKPEEKAKLEKDLAAILSYVDELRKLNTAAVEPTSHVLNMENVFREDQVRESGVRDKTLKHAPQTEGTLFKVPKTVDKES
ncbi:MAG: asparaginyl/glutamyl-tRNA amidotransferase subunit C [Omnitrophica bacterium GWA2_52_12]|nr:MAG: asparaginyl/glutamyl-tRNA amidotransferase subunit C [Omnitrophica bacterium GWA2_52_12]